MGLSRRAFLQITAGSGAAATGAALGAKTVERLLSYPEPPPDGIPGVATPYATGCRECPAGCGMFLWHRDGRATKAEPLPDHPVSRGGLCPRGQSAVQGEYDPDRLRQVLHQPAPGNLVPSTWQAAIKAIAGAIRNSGGRIALLSDLQTGALAEVMQAFVAAFGSDRLAFCEPFSYDPLRAAHARVFGRGVIPRYRLDRCEFIISFAADFLEAWVSPVEYAWQFAAMHECGRKHNSIGRMAYVGPRLSMTAANADHHLLTPPGAEAWVAWEMLRHVLEKEWNKKQLGPLQSEIDAIFRRVPKDIPSAPPHEIHRFAREFAHAPSSVALACPVAARGELAELGAIAAALLNHVMGRVGGTADFAQPHALSKIATEAQMRRFLAGIREGDALIVHAANPVYARADAREAIERAALVVHLGPMPDETAVLADWILPVDPPLESWGDYEPYAGIHNLLQPTMGRLYDTRLAGDVLLAVAAAAGKPLVCPHGTAEGFEGWLRARWRRLHERLAPDVPFEEFWRQALRQGGAQEEPERVDVTLPEHLGEIAVPEAPATTPADQPMLWTWAPITLFDGRLANRGWMQEIPEPVSYVAWGSWVDVHPAQAAALDVESEHLVSLETDAGNIVVPVRVTEDVVPGVAAVPFGQGHWALGETAAGIGANAFELLGRSESPGPFGLVRIRKLEDQAHITTEAMTQDQHGRDILKWMKLSELRKKKPGEGEEITWPLPEGYIRSRDMYQGHRYQNHRWAMVIDLHRCIGCGACSAACYAENNIPVVGKANVAVGREMAWIKAVPYRHPEHRSSKEERSGHESATQAHAQAAHPQEIAHPRRLGWLPLPCQHCDAAPCEPVCPVFAAVHNEEGLNAQIYNRCIGTRYCSNNCPYKVRRFNWLNVELQPPLHLQLNPEVSVRSRGVMEKCTFCVQRIRQAEYEATREDRPVRDGEVMPACVQTCPTRAFTFGDLLDPNSEVRRLIERSPRRYQVLHHLNTKPAVVYLQRIEIDESHESPHA